MYKCKRCGYVSDIRSNILRHLKKKKTCLSLLEDVPVEKLIEELKQMSKPTDGRFHCIHCHRMFNDRSNMYKHVHVCKSNPLTRTMSLYVVDLETQMASLAEKLKELETNQKKVVNQTNNIHVNHTTNIMNIDIKSFGRESRDHLSNEFLNKCFSDRGILELLESLHFDRTCPQNHNVRLRSKKQELMEVFHDGKWEVRDQDKTLTELIQNGYRILRSHGNKNKEDIKECEDIDDDEYDAIVKWLETIYEDKQTQKPLKKDLIILFMNNQTMLLGRDHV